MSVRHRKPMHTIVGVTLVLLFAAVIAVIAMSVTPSSDSDPLGPAGSGISSVLSPDTLTPQAPLEKPPVKLEGTWAAENNGVRFEAAVSNEVIKIQIANNGTTMLYWVGTFTSPDAVGGAITSNRIEVDKAVLSTATSKVFTVQDNTLSFEFKMMGKTDNVELVRS